MTTRDDPRVRDGEPVRALVDLPPGICRRCVRAVSRRVSDLPGVVWLEFDPSSGVLRVGGEVDLAALRRAGFPARPGPAPETS